MQEIVVYSSLDVTSSWLNSTPYNAQRSPLIGHVEEPIIIDSWQIFPELRYSGTRKRSWYFEILNDCIVPMRGCKRKPGRAGTLSLSIPWPAQDPCPAVGLLELVHPAWNTLPRIAVCARVPTAFSDDYDWRFMCPIKRTWENKARSNCKAERARSK